MKPVKVTVLAAEFRERPYILRMPFRFGVTTATHGKQTIAKVRVAVSGAGEVTGYAAEALGAKWFDKNLALSDADNHNQLRRSLELASDAYLAAGASTPFSLFAEQYDQHVSACQALALNPLIASYGQSLMDRAVVDAVCRAFNISFYAAVQTNLVGLKSHPIIADIEGFDFDRFLAALSPSNVIAIRHTVGLADPITEDDQEPGQRVGDGLPETLEEVVSFYGNRYFKIKISGDRESDLDRLRKIARVLDQSISDYHVTLDGNEQFTDGEQVSRFLDELLSSPDLNRLRNAVLYLEQPINRSRALNESVELLAEKMPVIIDESDGELSAFVQAKKLGYTGVSSKTCKGIYKSIVNRARCEVWNAANGKQFFMSAEDLTCEPGLSLQQDLCLVSLLGMRHVERNAHHFIDGFGGRPSSESEAFARSHPDLYRNDNGRIRLNIRNGSLDIGSLGNPGFGSLTIPELNSAEVMPRSTWHPEETHE